MIESVFAQLAGQGPPSLSLQDDAAVLTPGRGEDLVLTKDLLVAGRHFFSDDAPDLIARKLMRVNLSDLAAMGAEPRGFLLGLAAESGFDPHWVRRFAGGLARDIQEFQCPLWGGDTVSGAGRMVLSLTAIGAVPTGGALLRSGAQSGDLVFVSGTLGDAALGLQGIRGEIEAVPELTERYYLPQPRLALGVRLRGLASACIDVSDGFLADLGHICSTSGVGARVRAQALPVSAAGQRLIDLKPHLLSSVATGGDDYELVVTAPPDRRGAIEAAANALGVPMTVVGEIKAGEGVSLVDAADAPLQLTGTGFQHE